MSEKCPKCREEYHRIVKSNKELKESDPKAQTQKLPIIGELRIDEHSVTCNRCDYYECKYRQCKHPEKEHINGSCYFVTEPEKKNSEMFCGCDSQHGQNLRLFRDLGKMEPEEVDCMVTKACGKCRGLFLMRLDQELCTQCTPYEQPKLIRISQYIIRKPLSQEELQKIL